VYSNATISSKATIGQNVVIKDHVVIEDHVIIGDDCYIDYGAVIKENVRLGRNGFVGAQCILGEYLGDFFEDKINKMHPLEIGSNAVIRSGSILYGDTVIGSAFQAGHRICIREKAVIGDHVSIGTLSDIQGSCEIGNHTRLHSNVHIGQTTKIGDHVWIFPYVVATNDPTPPSDTLLGVIIEDYACVCTGAIILPGKVIGKDSLVGAAAMVTKDVPENMAVVGNPAKPICRVEDIKDTEGRPHYPWREYFKRELHLKESEA
jgi:acetyltransferase-like isoleucine patch superfamily enzyme